MKISDNLFCKAFLFVILVLSACNPPVEPPVEEPVPASRSCANVWDTYYASGTKYLGVVNGGTCVNASELIIDFVEPVEAISLSFSGASTSYVLKIFDGSGTELGREVQQAEFNNGDGTLFEIGFSSDTANIKRVQFSGPLGGPGVVIAVREISFTKAGVVSRYNFDTFPDGTAITADSQDSEGRKWRSLTGREFEDWGFLVSTNLNE